LKKEKKGAIKKNYYDSYNIFKKNNNKTVKTIG